MLTKQGTIEPNPKQQFLTDLESFVNTKRSAPHHEEVILSLDENEPLIDPNNPQKITDISKLLRNCGMRDRYEYNTRPPVWRHIQQEGSQNWPCSGNRKHPLSSKRMWLLQMEWKNPLRPLNRFCNMGRNSTLWGRFYTFQSNSSAVHRATKWSITSWRLYRPTTLQSLLLHSFITTQLSPCIF